VKRAEWERLISLALRGDDIAARCPGSRYALTAGMCAVYAAAAHLVLRHTTGEGYDPLAERLSLDNLMSSVVNDHPDPAEMIAEYWFTLPRFVRQDIGQTRSYVRTLGRNEA
jgi:hypothetical protein